MKKRLLSALIVLAMILTLVPAMILTTTAADFQASEGSFDEVAGVLYAEPFKMIYVEGGTFTIGWTYNATSGVQAPADTSPITGVQVSSFYIGETEVTQNLYRAVMGQASAPSPTGDLPQVTVSFYDAHRFLARLYVLTGKVYRLATEAEWEFAAKGGVPGHAAGDHLNFRYAGSDVESEVCALGSVQPVKSHKPNRLGIYDMSGNIEEWVWNAWSSTHTGGVNPTGIDSPVHAQRTRLGGTHAGETYLRYASARQVRSIDGTDGTLGFRIALSAEPDFLPPKMVAPRNVAAPTLDDRDTPNSYRDPRLITGQNQVWLGHFVNYGATKMKLWEDGTMSMQPFNVNQTTGVWTANGQPTNGQWYTVNNICLVLYQTGGTRIQIPYVTMDYGSITVINDRQQFLQSPYGRYQLQPETGTPGSAMSKPTVTGLVATANLRAGTNPVAAAHILYDMDNIPQAARQQDSRLNDGENRGWYMGAGAGGEHQYRKDFEMGEDGCFRFAVFIPNLWENILARGTWFTVDNMFLRVNGPLGETADYVYCVSGTSNNEFRHLSFQSYERGDSRMLTLTNNSAASGHPTEIEKGPAQLMGSSTFRKDPPPPPPCPGLPGKGTCGDNIQECTCVSICPIHDIHIYRCSCNDAATRALRLWLKAQIAVAALPVDDDSTAADFMAAVQGALPGNLSAIQGWNVAFNKQLATDKAGGLLTGSIRLAVEGATEDVIVNRSTARLPRQVTQLVTWVLKPGAKYSNKTLTITAAGIMDEWYKYDLGALMGNPAGQGPWNYLIFCDPGSTITFDQDVELRFQGVVQQSLAAGDPLVMTAATTEYAVTLDDSNTVVFVYQPSPGFYSGIDPDLPLSEFPGETERVIQQDTWILEPDALYKNKQLEITAKGIMEDWYNFNLGALMGGNARNYALFFDPGNTVTFNVEVQFLYQGQTKETLPAGVPFEVNAATTEYAVQLDDGNYVVLVYEPSPGYYAGIVPDLPLSAFPGKVRKLGEVTPPVPTTYGVTYVANFPAGAGAESGTVPVDAKKYAAGETVTVLGNTGNLTKAGYAFKGWATTATEPPEPPEPPQPGVWTIVPNATVGGSSITITATGLVDGWSQFDLSSIIGTSGPGPFTYALWFEDGGTISFSQDVTLSYQGNTNISVAANEVVEVDASLSEFALTMGDNNSIIIILQSSPGNFAQLPPNTSLNTFPGTITKPDGTVVGGDGGTTEPPGPGTDPIDGAWTIIPNSTVGGSSITITATGLFDGWSQFDLAILNQSTGGPYTYALWFYDGGTISFSRSVTLSYQGSTNRSVAANTPITVDANLTEYALSLGDGNSIIIILRSSPGNFAQLPPNTSLSSFPGTIIRPSTSSGILAMSVSVFADPVTVYKAGDTYTMGAADVVLYGVWEVATEPPQTYGVTYNGNGATAGTAPVDSTAYLTGANVTVLGAGNLARTGYTFLGWATTASATAAQYTAGNTFAMGSANVTLYAVWSLIPTYTVTYNGNGATGGTAPVDSNTYATGANVTVLGAGNLVRTGYTFLGWATTASATAAQYTAGSTFAMGSANVTLYAVWSLIPTYTVTYNANFPTGAGATSGTVPVDTAAYAAAANVTVRGNTGNLAKVGYTFQGWATTASATTAQYVAGSTFAMGSANVTLYGVWTLDAVTGSFTVSFDVDGTVTQALVAEGLPVIRPADPTKTGYTFIGWYLGAEAYDFSAPVMASFTLTAKWDIIVTSVTITTSGGTPLPALYTVPRNTSLQLATSVNNGDGSSSSPVSWKISDSSYATINTATGVITAKNKVGVVALTATVAGVSTTVMLRIT